MDINIYQQCPCNSGKKIKFCCAKDIVNDLNQILSKNKSGQALSALNQIERLTEKIGRRDCLLAIQTHILISNGEVEKAKESNAHFLANSPKNTLGIQHAALIELADGNTMGAVARLQDAMDSIEGSQIPIFLANAFKMVGVGLLHEGQVLAARAHLQYAQLLKGQPDDEMQQLMFETFRFPNGSILLKHDYRLDQPPEDKPWSKSYKNVIRCIDRGQFRRALRIAAKLDELNPDELILRRAIAILNTFLANLSDISDAWKTYSRTKGITEWNAVEAEAMSQLFCQEPITSEFDVVRTSFEVDGGDRLMEVALECDRLVLTPEINHDPFEEGPAPRAAFYFLNKNKLADASNLTIETTPIVCGEVLFYGKQTDRNARLEWVATRNGDFDEYTNDLKNVFSDLIQGDEKETVIGKTTAVSDVLNWEWNLPQDVTREQHEQLVAAQREKSLLETWTQITFSVLNHKTPVEASQDPELAIPLKALILHLDQSLDSQITASKAVAALRTKLGLDEPKTIDPTSLPDGASPVSISPVQQQYLDCSKLTDDELLHIQSEAMAIGNMAVLRNVVPEILQRENLDDKIPRDISLSIMAQLVDDTEQGLDFLHQARSAAKSNNRPTGVYLVQEFEFRLSRGMTDKLPELLQQIQTHHIKEPNVEYQLARVLHRFGLVGPGGRMQPVSDGPAPELTSEPESSSGIWTPESESAAAATAGEEGESKLWLPGSD